MARRGRMTAFAVTAGVALLAAAPASAQTYGMAPVPGEQEPEVAAKVRFEQTPGAQLPTALTFHDHDGRAVTLAGVLGAKPAILVLHYNNCPKLCSVVFDDVLTALNGARRSDPEFVAGGPFNVVFVSIDPKESPIAARRRRQEFHRQYDGRGDDAPGVWFLTANHGQGTDVPAADRTIHELADAVGFKYVLRAGNRVFEYQNGEWLSTDKLRTLPADVRKYDYQHPSGVVVLTPDGVVSRYLLGLKYEDLPDAAAKPNYSRRDLRYALIEASGGKIGTTVDQVAMSCFVYDQVKGHYRPAMRILGLAAAPFVVLVLGLTFWTWRRARRESPVMPPVLGDAGGVSPPPVVRVVERETRGEETGG